MRVEASAPGKLILFGEYAVLEGATAVATAVDRRAHVAVSPSAVGSWTVTSDLDDGRVWSLDARGEHLVDASGETPWIVRAVEETLRRQGTRPADLPPLAFEVRSAAFFEPGARSKLGLGSSAAVVVALGSAMRRLLRRLLPRTCEATAAEACADDLHVHHALRGAGSGVDVATSFHGGVIAFTRESGAGIERLEIPADLHVACVWTGTSTSTAAFLEHVQRCRTDRPGAYRDCIEHMANVAGRAVQAIRGGRGADLPALADEYHRGMAAFGDTCGIPVVSEAHESLAQLARAAGAAYKPSGAGGGDVGLLLAERRRVLDAAAQAIQDAGYGFVDLTIGETGVTIRTS